MRNKDPRPIREINGVIGKECTRCNEFKSLTDFNRDKRSRDSYKQGCRDCTRRYYSITSTDYRKRFKAEKIRQRKHEDPKYRERMNSYTAKFWLTPRGRADRLWRGAVKSKQRYIEGSTLTFEHVLKGVERGTCEVTGISFDLKSPINTQYNPFAPSLDRINPKLPYTDENVRVVIWQFNLMKGEISDAQLYLIANLVIKGLEEQWQSKQ